MGTMRKISFVVFCLATVVLLAGCTAKVESPLASKRPLEFSNVNGTAFSSKMIVSSGQLPLAFEINFRKTSGALKYRIETPSGKTIEEGTLLSNAEFQKNQSEAERATWGIFTFAKTSEEPGVFKVEVLGENASGIIQINPKYDTGFTNFTGIASEAIQEAKDSSQKINFSFHGAYESGTLTAKVFAPDGKQLYTARISSGQKLDNPVVFSQKAGQTGTFRAIIESEKTTGQAVAISYTEEEIPWVASLRPILFLLLAIAAIVSVGKKNMRVMVWGAMIFLVSNFVGQIIGEIARGNIAKLVNSPYSYLVPTLSGVAIIAIIVVIGLYFSKSIAEMKTITPRELYGFAVGYIMVEPLLSAYTGFTSLFGIGSSNVPVMYGAPLPGVYPSTSLAIYDLTVPFLQRGMGMVITLALVIWVLWSFRRQTHEGMKTWAVFTLAIIAKIVMDVLMSYFNVLPVLGVSQASMLEQFPFGSSVAQGIVITLIIFAGFIAVLLYRQKLARLSQEACAVTIDQLRAQK